jgi:pyridoxal phosphate enzyme (YggS family)
MVAENVKKIRQQIAATCLRAGRMSEEVLLIAVSKTFSSHLVREALAAGIHDIGENYIQELRQKHDELDQEDVRWHFIGHLQSNKVKYIAPWIHCIQAVDSMGLGKEIDKYAANAGRTITILVEVNTSREQSKFGVLPEETVTVVKQLSRLQHVHVDGLMTIGPFLPDPESSRPSFRVLRELKSEVEKEGIPMHHLSMGMTNDFEVAIEEGATMVRIGTAIFGKRAKRTKVQ